MIEAIIEEARPLNLLRRYQALAAAGKRIIRSDIPSELLPAFVDLAVEIKGASVRSVVFRSSEEFFPGDPDFAWMRQVVRKALAAPAEPPRQPGDRTRPEPSAGPSVSPSPVVGPSDEPEPGAAVEAADTCGYHPATS